MDSSASPLRVSGRYEEGELLQYVVLNRGAGLPMLMILETMSD